MKYKSQSFTWNNKDDEQNDDLYDDGMHFLLFSVFKSCSIDEAEAMGSSEEENSIDLSLKLIMQMDEFRNIFEKKDAKEIDEVLTRKKSYKLLDSRIDQNALNEAKTGHIDRTSDYFIEVGDFDAYQNLKETRFLYEDEKSGSKKGQNSRINEMENEVLDHEERFNKFLNEDNEISSPDTRRGFAIKFPTKNEKSPKKLLHTQKNEESKEEYFNLTNMNPEYKMTNRKSSGVKSKGFRKSSYENQIKLRLNTIENIEKKAIPKSARGDSYDVNLSPQYTCYPFRG